MAKRRQAPSWARKPGGTIWGTRQRRMLKAVGTVGESAAARRRRERGDA